MLDVHTSTIRLFLHVLGVTVWVGGQIVLVGLLPVLRTYGQEPVVAVARRFHAIAWAAFLVIVITGIWNILDVDLDVQSDEYLGTFSLKMTLVLVSGACAAAHAVAGRRARQLDVDRARAARAAAGVLGAGALLSALGATVCGIQLSGG